MTWRKVLPVMGSTVEGIALDPLAECKSEV